jgi:glycosyltransferase involved in cell wall biosynthesis
MIRITHIITSLDTGGAEMMLYRLAEGLKQRQFEQQVICLRPAGSIAAELIKSGIPVSGLGMDASRPSLKEFQKLVRLIKIQKPDIIQTWMYHADLLGSLAAQFAGHPAVIWGIHNAGISPASMKTSTRFVARCLAVLSRWLPVKIIVCSESALNFHAAYGYDRKKMVFIPNGFDLSLYKPLPGAGKAIREELGIPLTASVVGIVARFHPDKDPGNFIRAATHLVKQNPDVYFLMCGEGFSDQNTDLTRLIPAGLKPRMILTGTRLDIACIINALDLFTLSSAREAFPLTIGEAMASEIPCVATDVGDIKKMIGETGLVVPRQNADALAMAWKKMLNLAPDERAELGKLARKRIFENYRLEDVVDKYVNLYMEMDPK